MLVTTLTQTKDEQMSQLEYNNNTRKNQHINFEERKIIERMLQAGAKIAEIAKLLLRDASTIKREIKRGSVEQQETVKTTSKNPNIPLTKTVVKYFADVGQRVYEEYRQNCGAKNKIIKCKALDSVDTNIASITMAKK